MQLRSGHKLTATPKGILLDEKPLNKFVQQELSPYALRYIKRAGELLKRVSPEDWEKHTPHHTNDVPQLAKAQMMLALANPIILSKYRPDQLRDWHGRWTDENSDTAQQKDSDSLKSQTLNYKTVEGGQELSSWSIKWELSHPSPKGGIIVQEVVGHAKVSDGTQTVEQPYHYWEAWTVPPGSTTAKTRDKTDKYDDIFIDNNSGRANLRGSDSGTTTAIFYEGVNLPPTFIAHNPRTFADALPSTTIDPKLPKDKGTAAVVRTWSINY